MTFSFIKTPDKSDHKIPEPKELIPSLHCDFLRTVFFTKLYIYQGLVYIHIYFFNPEMFFNVRVYLSTYLIFSNILRVKFDLNYDRSAL